MESTIYTTPVVANDTLYIANRNRLFAIKPGARSEPLTVGASPGTRPLHHNPKR